MLALAVTNANPSPDGDSYGSRWSRAKRETTGHTSVEDHDPGGARQGSRTMLALAVTNANPSPDGDSYGSRWSRAERETTRHATPPQARPRMRSRTMLAMPSTHTRLHTHIVFTTQHR